MAAMGASIPKSLKQFCSSLSTEHRSFFSRICWNSKYLLSLGYSIWYQFKNPGRFCISDHFELIRNFVGKFCPSELTWSQYRLFKNQTCKWFNFSSVLTLYLYVNTLRWPITEIGVLSSSGVVAEFSSTNTKCF